MLMDPHLSQQHAGLQYTVLQPKTRPKASLKPTLPDKCVVDGEQSGAILSWSVASPVGTPNGTPNCDLV